MELPKQLKAHRERLGLSQEAVAQAIYVSRQTMSSWENGLSVPDSDMLVSLSDTLDAPVAALLGEAVSEPEADDLRALAESLEVVSTSSSRAGSS